ITEERQSREALQTQAAILENMEEGVVVTDDQGLIVQMNPAAERIWRYTQSDILGRPASVLSGLPEPEASEGLREVLATLHATGSWRGMLKNRHQNGEAFFCEAVMSRLKIHGRVLLVAVEQDVTEHKRVEAVLRESEQTYRALVEITGTGYLILDLLGRVVDANAEYVRLSGHQVLKEILGRNLSEWTALHDRPITIAALGECAKTRSVRNLEIIYAGPNGLLTPIEINATVVGTEQGARIICLCRDITQRKQTELALARTEELYPSLFELSPDGILLEDTEGNILDANQAICDTFGYSRQELVGANVRLWVPPAENGAVASHLAVLRAGQGLEHEVWNRRKNGQVRLMKLNEKPLVLPDGHQDILVVARDITESKQIEEALHKAHDRLELRVQERTAELQAANAALAANETRLRLALEASNAGTWEWDVAGDQSVWDERYHELYGFEPDEPISFTT
ncbi:MAG: PAS domain S-box protein, partial [Verrucomicrobia bacterium]|nr:PAS domain S-box protein [Verrucomicrobiota bacterium]